MKLPPQKKRNCKLAEVKKSMSEDIDFLLYQDTVRQATAKMPFLRNVLAHTSARASERKMPNTEGPLPLICVQTAP